MFGWLRIVPNIPLMAGSTVAVCTALAVPSAASGQHTDESLDRIREKIRAGDALLVDVREKSEWESGHLEHAIFVPLSELAKRVGDEQYRDALREKLSEKKVLYTHCRSGGRCVIAAEPLRRLGYEVRPLKPGFKALVESGFEPAGLEPEEQ
ncbi:rhodanese-like domain-containing protein [Stratiformator vulcanicus]|uniref:Molybdopterin biosynthesis protein MoeB n=1 Tax=Stratiformator vulcanicus TaxID=2527980 RepID=A0A517QW92_9PLAN|nr:rhodanese-like domain-containing protein [Stratiformator vulcanicus]QDT35848.1 molybdopterin biosynthesis protein MoeB [Stratiformator vulcanicus]